MRKKIIIILTILFLSISSTYNVYAASSNDPIFNATVGDVSGNNGGLSATQLCSLIPEQISNIISTIVTIIKIGVPIILIVMGMIDMGKAVASQKDDEIKKGQKTLISRCIAAGIVFFVTAIVQLLVSIVANGNNEIWTCISSLVNGS